MLGNHGVGQVVRVAQDGSGHYLTVQAAIDAVPLCNTQRVVISIAAGVYRQPIYVPKTKNLITLQGANAHDTLLTWSNTATNIEHHQASRVIGTGTFACGSVIVEGEDFIAQGLTFENGAPQGSGQAVAIRVTADRCAFYNCRFLGWQDTAYLHYGRHYFRDCYIEGSVDFIFGNGQVLLEHCHIHCKSNGFITAQQHRNANETTGFVFLTCVITGTGSGAPYMHLGRPWAPCARVIFAYTWMDTCILPVGWNNWNDRANEKTACYVEYKCSGPGSNKSQRCSWARQLQDSDAAQFLSPDFIDPQQSWLTQRFKDAPPYVPVPLSARAL
jgi:pectinesterase